MVHLTTEQLQAGLAHITASPSDRGTLDLIVRRPATGEREAIDVGALDPADGLVGDSWRRRAGFDFGDDPSYADTQVTLMNSRVIALIAQDVSRWALAGDQLFVDFDLSRANLPPGTQLALGTSILEVSAEPHTGCRKFVTRFGLDAMKFVNSPLGTDLRLRGLNARVVRGGTIRLGDVIAKSRLKADNTTL